MKFVKNVILQIPTHGQKLTNIKFINEIASTHDGSTKELNKLVKDIKINKGDYIKFQILKIQSFVTKLVNLFKGLKK